MAQEIEIEFKNLLTKKEFNLLLHRLPFPAQSQKQINYYFETNDFSLSKNMCALRIRENNKTYKLTLKQPHPDGLLETTDILTRHEALSWIRGHIIPKQHTYKQLHQMNVSPSNLIYIGQLITERREVKYDDVLLVLDHSSYNSHEDFELEVEAESRKVGLHTFNQILKKYNIQKKKTPNKIERFFSSV